MSVGAFTRHMLRLGMEGEPLRVALARRLSKCEANEIDAAADIAESAGADSATVTAAHAEARALRGLPPQARESGNGRGGRS